MSAKSQRSLYETLGIGPGASLAEIRQARKERIKARHPDTGGTEASAEAFQEIQTAWLVLRDPKLREHYDRTGEIPSDGPDLRESQVLGVISGTLANLLSQPLAAIVSNPVISVMRQVLAEEIANTQKNSNECLQKIAKIEKLKRKFRKRGEGENVLVKLLEGHISQLTVAIENNKASMSLREEARELLSDYEFDQELPQWMNAGFGWSGMASPYGAAQQSAFRGSLGSIFGDQ